MGAILDAILRIGKVAAAFGPQCVQGAIAEQAAETTFVRYLMAGEIFAFFVLKKVVMSHIDSPVSM